MSKPNYSLHRFSRTRRGQSLLMVFLMLVVLAGILALILDFGFVLQARRQMQTGVNTSALEGLRDVDADNDGAGDGRQDAARLMQNVFDDDFDPTGNNTTVGAGIDSSLVQGNGFQQTILGNGTGSADLFQNRSNFIFRPIPQLNESNAQHGDFVFGSYDESAMTHNESADYSRDDFIAEDDSINQTAFLSRLRRTHDPDGLDRVPGISSGGGGLPLLIGRLSWFSAQSGNSGYSIRRDGVLVRATGIADEKIAVRVWLAGTSDRIYGAIPFGVSKSDFIANADPISFIQPTTSTLTQFGQVAEFASTGSYAGETGYIAVIDTMTSPSRVLGFWLAKSTTHETLLPNTSSRMQDVWSVFGELTATERTALFQSRQEIVDDASQKLLSSVALVRSNE